MTLAASSSRFRSASSTWATSSAKAARPDALIEKYGLTAANVAKAAREAVAAKGR